MEQEPAEQHEQENGKKSEEDNQVQKGNIPTNEQLYDLVIPPGTPQTIIIDVSNKFDVEVVTRKEKLYFANMSGDERELLAFRGKLNVMQKVEPYFYEKMKEFIGET
jgi:hypothetical protein